MKLAKTLRRGLEKIYSRIPEFKCQERCGECCGPVRWSLAEEIVIRDYIRRHGIEYRKMKSIMDYCPFLTEDKKCSIYPVRPLVCRVYGVLENLRCPYIKPEKYMSLEEFFEMEKEIAKLSKEIAIQLGVLPNEVMD
jgi:hypothetical protein